MTPEGFTSEEAAEEMRKKHLYRQLILSGKLVLPYSSAARLLGPDCLYQLYSRRESENPRPAKAGHVEGRRGTARHRRPSRKADDKTDR